MSTSVARGVTFAVCVIALAGCTVGSENSSDPVATSTVEPSVTTRSPASTHSGSPSGGSQVVLPTAEQGLTTLLTAGPQSGPAIAGRVSANRGELWVNLNCQGYGALVLKFEPLDKFTFECGQGVFLSKNQINLLAERQMKIVVETSTDVTWALRVEQ